MKLELPKIELEKMLLRQIENLFYFKSESEKEIIRCVLDSALERTEYCFSQVSNKYYRQDSEVYFNPFHGGQNTVFLYFLSNELAREHGSDKTLADRVYYLNKALNGVDLFYEVAVPKVFFVDHPGGSVLGRAEYGDYFSFAQNCTVGNNNGHYPIIGKHVRMAAGSTLIGKCKVGDQVIIAAHAYVKDTDIPSQSIVFGTYPNLTIKPQNEEYFRHHLVNFISKDAK